VDTVTTSYGPTALTTTTPSTSGVTTNGSDITLTATTGDLTISQALSTGSSSAGVITLDSASGASTESGAGGAITAGSLRLLAANTSNLNGSNSVGTFAANITGAGQAVSLNNTADTQLGTVTTTNGATPSLGTTSGVTTNQGDIRVVTSGTLTLAQDINTGDSSHTLTLGGGAGGISQTTGKIAAGKLEVASVGDVSLTNTQNTIGTVAASVTTGGFDLRNATDLIIGTAGSTQGITAGGVIDVRGAGNLQVANPVIGNASVNNAIILSAANAFNNTAGSAGVSAPNGRWLIYDVNPTLDMSRLGGLTPAFQRLQITIGNYPPSSVTESGNGYLTTAVYQPPEQLSRPLSGASSSELLNNNTLTATGAGGTQQIQNMGAFYVVDTPLKGGLPQQPMPIFSQSGGTGQSISTPLVIRLSSGSHFLSPLSEYIGTGQIESMTLESGAPVPPWMGVNSPGRIVFGTLPQDFSGELSLRLNVRDQGASRPREMVVRLLVSQATQ
jgi:hypothetical protein